MMSRLTLPTLLLSSLLALAALSGCATVDQKIGLTYSPVDRSFGRQQGEIAIARIDPATPAKNPRGEWIIGSLNNVHGVHQADLLSDRSLGEWITEALQLELKHTGYTVTTPPSLPNGVQRGILISDINGFMNVNKGTVTTEAKHELKFNIDLYLNGLRAKSFTVASRDTQTVPLTASKEAKEKMMLQSLQDAVQQIVPEIIALTAKK